MSKTRLSLIYPAGYLSIGGFSFLFAPHTTLSLFLSNGAYSDLMVRILGTVLLALAFVVVQIIRVEATQLYFTSVLLQVWVLTALIAFYVVYRDPMLLILVAIIGPGIVLTVLACVTERKSASHGSGMGSGLHR